ncbi:MAG TPA: FAD-dependent oxidoreductase [Verrucomicrobiae bacterium]|nr:FAD-dependent oxidoreductase [Verrucomicrobiae bacterium]
MQRKKDAGSALSRRGFLGSAAAFAGYSLIVRAPAARAAEGAHGPTSHEAIKAALAAIEPKPKPSELYAAEPGMSVVDLDCELMVAGGGMAGVCAALAAARNGARVVLVQDRSRLGGNASSEVRMHIVGADKHGSRKGWREGGIIEELRLEDAARNPHRAYELWDLMLYDKIVCERNITLLLDTAVFRAEVKDGRIGTAWARCDKTETLYRVRAPLYADCTGDSRLGFEAGAEFHWGREGKLDSAEELAPDVGDSRTQGSSILFTARQHDRPMPFTPPSWAKKISETDLVFRKPTELDYGYWWIELGGMGNTIKDNERLRFELLSIVLGVWDYIKNSGARPDAANWALEFVGMVPGKRESRRLLGPHVFVQPEIEGAWKQFTDGVAIGGWAMDEHPPEGFYGKDIRPFTPSPVQEVYNIPFRSLYSKNVANLLMAGRNISASHVAFTSTRVMATCAVMGQAAGTAAALCAKDNILPKELSADPGRVVALQQRLLLDDQSIRNIRNEDPADLARAAEARASAAELGPAANVLTGEVRDMPDEWKHRWGTRLTGDTWIELAWKKPQRIGWVQITFDTGFERELTLTASAAKTAKMIRGPQPETIRDYTVELIRGEQVVASEKVEGNFHRLRRHCFQPAEADRLRIRVQATNGSDRAAIFEIRAYRPVSRQ